MNKTTYNSLQEAKKEHYTIHPVEGKIWWHDEEMQKVPGAYIEDDDGTRSLPLMIREEMLLAVLNEAIWDNMHGWKQYFAETVMDNPENYPQATGVGNPDDLPKKPLKKDSPFIAKIRHIVDITTLSDEDILDLREFSTGILTSTEYNKWLEDSGYDDRVDAANRMLECPEDYPEVWGIEKDDFQDDGEEHHHMDGPLEVNVTPDEKPWATPHADAAIKMMKDTRALLDSIAGDVYDVFHLEDGMCNTGCHLKGRTFKLVHTLRASSLDAVFARTQNTDWNTNPGFRSTSVGDIIRKGTKYWMVMGMDFKDLELDWANITGTKITFKG